MDMPFVTRGEEEKMDTKKEYTKVKFVGAILLGIAILYLISPIDVLPDILPIVGLFDDAIVGIFSFAMAKNLK